jgi:hypothetical protein
VIKSSDVKYSVDANGRVSTTFTPAVKEVFKGNYNGKRITTLGGIINCDDYKEKFANEFKTAVLTENSKAEKVEYCFGNIPIVKEGDLLIVFCSEKNGVNIITNSFEGLFKINGDCLINDAIKNTALLSDICSENSSKIAKDAFIAKIKAF